MRTIEEIKQQLESYKDLFNFNPNEIEQGSDEWLHLKLGVISASNAHNLLKGQKTAGRLGYMDELVSQVTSKEMPQISAKAMEWGKNNEMAAREVYKFETGRNIVELPFIFGRDSIRYGASPDGYGDNGLELKCPFTGKVHVAFVGRGEIKKEYIEQCQYSMFVTDAEFWEFGSYDPRNTAKEFHSVRIDRDEKKMKSYADAIPQFIEEMDKMLANFGVEFGSQWQ